MFEHKAHIHALSEEVTAVCTRLDSRFKQSDSNLPPGVLMELEDADTLIEKLVKAVGVETASLSAACTIIAHNPATNPKKLTAEAYEMELVKMVRPMVEPLLEVSKPGNDGAKTFGEVFKSLL